ncbi:MULTISPECIES: nucleotidyltransferase family protein [Thiorhodovibrio]|uniref:nucleotidyltransferase family protein n=1 Tax=Thiorhodovibrio TaxID=61593 RepID=UPI001912568C|nr:MULTISPECIES: nucleotidyltransferase family protein [Thiorhodovibrio]MBK5967537.1 molybdopterin-guanine dinucleotide biosynthesis protein MobA [Thiorhodovibrio winogradskyi]WPL14069.1 Purine catabolism protein PucB [Thiorhodovibrio litoralis]
MPVGVLLAAGSSQRFGSDKRLHRLPDGTPMAVQSARTLQRALPRVLAVVREADEVADRLAAEGLEVILCPAAINGMGHSIACGVAASADADGWLIALADMPWIQPQSITAVATALAEGAAIARPVYAGQQGHPVGFSAAFGPALQGLQGDQGARHLLRRAALTEVPCPDPGVLRDLDR